MKLLTPQSPERIEWELKVMRLIEEGFDCCTSDAQSVLEANPNILDGCYKDELTTEETAKLLMNNFYA